MFVPWLKKQEIFHSFELLFEQVFTVPLEERRFKEMNENSFGDEGQTEQAKICKEIMAKHGKFLSEISSLSLFMEFVNHTIHIWAKLLTVEFNVNHTIQYIFNLSKVVNSWM